MYFGEVNYVDIAGGFTVGDMIRFDDLRQSSLVTSKWSHLFEVYSGPAVVFRSADAETWEVRDSLFLVFADELRILPGLMWPS
jgi:hypothetical protein